MDEASKLLQLLVFLPSASCRRKAQMAAPHSCRKFSIIVPLTILHEHIDQAHLNVNSTKFPSSRMSSAHYCRYEEINIMYSRNALTNSIGRWKFCSLMTSCAVRYSKKFKVVVKVDFNVRDLWKLNLYRSRRKRRQNGIIDSKDWTKSSQNVPPNLISDASMNYDVKFCYYFK